jgi:hypothetical protein
MLQSHCLLRYHKLTTHFKLILILSSYHIYVIFVLAIKTITLTTDDLKFKMISTVMTVAIISIMAFYESRKQTSLEAKIKTEKRRVEEILFQTQALEKKHEETKRQIEVLLSRNKELENPSRKSDNSQ